MEIAADGQREVPALIKEWEQRNHVSPPENQGLAQGWANPDFDDRDWKTVAMPATWAKALDVATGGVFWLGKTVDLPESVAGKPLALVLNAMNDQYDTTYFNGQEVGHSGEQPPLFTMSQRRYEIPGRLVKPGQNVITIRVVSASPRVELLQRERPHGDYNLPIHRHQVGNEWRVKAESLFPPLSAEALALGPSRTTPRSTRLPRSCTTR